MAWPLASLRTAIRCAIVANGPLLDAIPAFAAAMRTRQRPQARQQAGLRGAATTQEGAEQITSRDAIEGAPTGRALLLAQLPCDAAGPAPINPPDQHKSRDEAERKDDGKAHADPLPAPPALKFCVLK